MGNDEKLGSVIDEMDQFYLSLATLQAPDDMKIQAIQDKFPEWLDKLKAVHLYEYGENKWARLIA